MCSFQAQTESVFVVGNSRIVLDHSRWYFAHVRFEFAPEAAGTVEDEIELVKSVVLSPKAIAISKEAIRFLWEWYDNHRRDILARELESAFPQRERSVATLQNDETGIWTSVATIGCERFKLKPGYPLERIPNEQLMIKLAEALIKTGLREFVSIGKLTLEELKREPSSVKFFQTVRGNWAENPTATVLQTAKNTYKITRIFGWEE